MSEWNYSIDEIRYSFRNGGRLFVEGWLVTGEDTCPELTVHGKNGAELFSFTEWKERPDIREVRKDLSVPAMPGFVLAVPEASVLCGMGEPLEIWASGEKRKKCLKSISASEIRGVMERCSLFCHVDVVQWISDALEIQGWFFAQQGGECILVTDEKRRQIPAAMYRCRREDVRSLYGEYLERDRAIGFVLRILLDDLPSGDLLLHFSSGIVSREIKIDRKNLDRQNRQNKKTPPKGTAICGGYGEYRKWMQVCTKEALKEHEKQKSFAFASSCRIAVSVDVTGVPFSWLKKMMDSIKRQSFQNWICCLWDRSSSSLSGNYLRLAFSRENRIHYRKRTGAENVREEISSTFLLTGADFVFCMQPDTVLEPDAFFRMAEEIAHCPETEFLYMDEDRMTEDGKHFFHPLFKPDYNPCFLENMNYIGSHFLVRSETFRKAEKLMRESPGENNCFDFVLCCTDAAEKKNIRHLSRVLYHRIFRKGQKKERPDSCGRDAVAAHLKRTGIAGEVIPENNSGLFCIRHKLTKAPFISVIIPNKDHVKDLEKCLLSITEKSTYPCYEILIVENNSAKRETFDYYRGLPDKYPMVRVLTWEKEFSFSAINNFAAKEAKGEYLLFLNNDVEVISSDWMEEMLGYCMRPGVGIVGAKLLYPDDTVQHAGVVLGLKGVASHIFAGIDRDQPGYMKRAAAAQNVSAVTAACMMMRKSVFFQVEGFDEAFRVAYNDIDLCMKTTEAGWQIVENPRALLYHYESRSRGPEDTPEKKERFSGEIAAFREKWGRKAEQDPCFNPNLYELYGRMPLE